MSFDLLRQTYALAAPELDSAGVDAAIDGALERAREKHMDLDRFAPAIEFLATVFFCNHSAMPLDDYIETLYCAAKHSDFARRWRAELRKRHQQQSAPANAP